MAFLTGHITVLAHPFILCRLLTKNSVNVPQDQGNWCVPFQRKTSTIVSTGHATFLKTDTYLAYVLIASWEPFRHRMLVCCCLLQE